MDPKINKKKVIERIMNVLKKGRISTEGYNSTQIPFFMNDNNETEFSIDFEAVENIPEGLNRNIKLIYDILGNSKKEIYLDKWTIMSLETAMEIYDEYCQNGQTNVFDIGYRYLGMGHIEIISCDLSTHLLFYHRGGGSNGYDSEDNFQDIIKNGSNGLNQKPFTEWFYKIYLK